MKVYEFDSIIVTEFNDDKLDTLLIITDSETKNMLFDMLTYDSSRDFVKFYPRLHLTFKGQDKEESLGVFGNNVKGKNGTYKCPIDLEKKLRELVNQENAFINLEYGQENIVWNNKDNSFIHNYAYKSFVDKSIDLPRLFRTQPTWGIRFVRKREILEKEISHSFFCMSHNM